MTPPDIAAIAGRVKPWTPPDERSRIIYDYYTSGGKRGDLYKHFRAGCVGLQKPERGYANALAAWMAGRDAAVRAYLLSKEGG